MISIRNGAKAVYPCRAHMSSHRFCGVRVIQSLVSCVVICVNNCIFLYIRIERQVRYNYGIGDNL